MITADPARRKATFDDIKQRLAQDAAPEDRDLLLQFAQVAYADLPDAIALHLAPEAIAARIRYYFDFIARVMPAENQLYRGLPGLHVSVRNADDQEEAATGSASGHYHEVTIVETHTPDAPFIFESLKNFFQRENLRVFSSIHPIFTVHRQWERIVSIGGPTDDGSRELYTQFRIERIEARERLRRIEHEVYSLLKAVFLAVEDFKDMARTMSDLIARVQPRRPPHTADAARSFMKWLLDDNYVHLGMLKFLPGKDGELHPDYGSAMGAFKDPALIPVVFPGLGERMAQHVHPAEDDWRIVDIDYCVNAHAIHHLDPIDDLVVREWNSDGTLGSATLVLGRLAKTSFATRAQDIPILNEKLEHIQKRIGALPNSHAYREIRAVFNYFPKRELLYADGEALRAIIEKMVYMASDDEIVVTSRKGRGYTDVAIAFSDYRYSRQTEERLKVDLEAEFGPISFNTWADCGTTGVLIYYFDDASLEHPIDVEKVRAMTAGAITTWEDQAAVEIEKVYGALEGRRLFKKWVRTESRSGLYRETTKPEEVPEDLRRLEVLDGRLDLSVLPLTADRVTVKLFSPQPLGLTETLRTLENLRLTVREEMAIPLVLPEGRKGWMERLVIEADPKVIAAVQDGADRLLDALRALNEERATDDPLNGLVLLEGMTWRQTEVLRTLRNHILQVRPAYNAETITAVLLRNSQVARALLAEFQARFDPSLAGPRDAAMAESADRFRSALRKVASLMDDEILRALDNLLWAGVRTNFYQHPERPVVSIKVDSSKVESMVSPRPMFEIYVHSRLLEGIHLRGGKVARGGIRWSDRHDDFRTEILGLMKTQMVKNAVIVPVGSKGGFVLKGNVPPRPALDSYLIDRYRQFVSGLLDVTDNLVNGKVVNPPEVVRHDENDPYLVVAADKGTAHLSDTANSVSNQYGFWLGDAFASGGSVGYDHKKEGITARGAWECVIEHFRNLGHDVQTQPFTMAGVGDMSGDVFGNGALRSRATKLVAAFDHRNIFIDPTPDPERSFVERQRMFDLPRSSWRDYDASLISQGGGIFDRNAKSIPISPEMKALLDIDTAEASGEEVMRRILMAKVDLLYNGGIGTYIKASSEENVEVGDRSNDRVRIDAREVRARVVSEGGNLGLTQRARVEYWQHGGLLNTDAVDNSGGVDMSDHEVNLKILVDMLVRQKVIASRAARNELLAEMTDEVSRLVLLDNSDQARCITLDAMRSQARYDEHVGFLEELVTSGVVNRADDALPTKDELLASPSKDRGLPRPILAVLMGHTKNWAFRELLKTAVLDGETARPFLDCYFPVQLRQRFAEHFAAHPLRREIIGTGVVNYIVNRAGIAFLHRMMHATKTDLAKVVAAYLDVDRESGAEQLRQTLFAAKRPVKEEYQALLDIEAALEAAIAATLEGRKAKASKALDPLRQKVGV